MPSAEKAPVGHATLTRDAGSVRSWLVRWFARRVRQQADVEDMVQDVFVRIAARDSTERVEHLGGYVLKTAWSVMADRVRRRASRMAALHVPLATALHGHEEIDPQPG